MVLSWSRALFIDFSLDQQMETFLRMHLRALQAFGGIPKKILYDNLKSVVLHHVGSVVQFNPRFLSFAGHYLFEPVAAPVRYPEAKGRVEASIKFIRHAFFYGRSFSSLEDLRQQARAWCQGTANQRLHATTRERPTDRLLIERPRLRALPQRRFDTDLVLPLIVSKEARVHLDTNTYSVPPDYVGKTVSLRADDTTVRILCDGLQIAHHVRSYDPRRAIEDPAHIEKLLERRTAAKGAKRKQHLETLSPESRLYLQAIARKKIRLDHEVEKLDRLIDLYGQTDVLAAMAQALAKPTLGARYVRALIDQARFARGLPEPPALIVTGNPAADALTVEPHPMETYDALFRKAPQKTSQIPIPTPIPLPMSDLQTLSLHEVLETLGLDHAAAQLDEATKKAIARNDSPTSLLDYLMRDQLRVQLEARARDRLKRSAIFPLTTRDSYDFNHPESIDRDLVERAFTLDFIKDKSNCVLVGPSGVGKTHLANAIGQLACLRGHRVRFVVAADLVNDLVAAQAKNTLHRRLATWALPELLLVDELGYLTFDSRGADLLYQVFNRRYQRGSTIVTTNLAFKDWGQLFHNSAAASAIADRLVHKGILIRISGKSARSNQDVM